MGPLGGTSGPRLNSVPSPVAGTRVAIGVRRFGSKGSWMSAATWRLRAVKATLPRPARVTASCMVAPSTSRVTVESVAASASVVRELV